jgi:hypothetical protein
MGRRLAKREDIDVLRRPSKRPERFTRDVRASMGMLKRDMMLVDVLRFGEILEEREDSDCALGSALDVVLAAGMI